MKILRKLFKGIFIGLRKTFKEIVGLTIIVNLYLKNKSTTYLFVLPHIGDMCYALAYLGILKEKNNLEHITILATASNSKVCRLYTKTYNDILILSERNILSLYEILRDTKRFKNHLFKRIIDSNPIPLDYTYFKLPSVNANNMTKYIAYELSSDILPEFPKADIDNVKFKYFGQNRKSVIISPYAFTIGNINLDFFEKIAYFFLELGYDVYTNVVGSQSVIVGTSELRCGLDEIIYYADNSDFFIGMRSGIMDLIISCKCCIIAFFADYKYEGFYSLHGWGCNNKLMEVYGEPKLEEIFEFINEKMDA